MFGGDTGARERGDRAYYSSLPSLSWDEVGPELADELRRLHRLIGLVIAQLPREDEPAGPAALEGTAAEAPPGPAQLAFRLFDFANRAWAEVAAEEQDLRQVITTLRTALAVCWDLYSQRQAEQTSVAEHMRQLRDRIEDFEADLRALQEARESDTPG